MSITTLNIISDKMCIYFKVLLPVIYDFNSTMSVRGPSIQYVTLFLANFAPLPLSHFVTHPGTPPKVHHTSRTHPDFSRPSTKSLDKSPVYKSPLSIVRGGFVLGVLSGVFCLEGFVRCGFCPFPLLSEYICYNRMLNITLNFMFHMYDKEIYKRDVTCARPPSPCRKLSHFLGPPSPSSVTYFMDGPTLIFYFFDLIVTKFRFTRSRKCRLLHFDMKCSKALRFAWGA